MYGPANLQEIRELTGISLDYPNLAELEKMVAKHFEVLSCEERLEEFSFENPLMVLNHLRETGVNSLDKSSWSRKSLEDFSSNYQKKFRVKDGVLLSYHPMYCLARPRK